MKIKNKPRIRKTTDRRIAALFDHYVDVLHSKNFEPAAPGDGIQLHATGLLGELRVSESNALKFLAHVLDDGADALRRASMNVVGYSKLLADALLFSEGVLYRAGVEHVVKRFANGLPTDAQIFSLWTNSGTDYDEFEALLAERERRVVHDKQKYAQERQEAQPQTADDLRMIKLRGQEMLDSLNAISKRECKNSRLRPHIASVAGKLTELFAAHEALGDAHAGFRLMSLTDRSRELSQELSH